MAATALIQRYRFDRCFDGLAASRSTARPPAAAPAAAPAATHAPPEPGFTRQDIEHARAEGFARGRAEAAATEEQRRAAERQRLQALEVLVAEVRTLRDGAVATAEAATTQAVLVAHAIARKLLPRRWREGAAEEIAEMVRRTLAGLAEPREVSVRIASDLHATLQAELLAMAAEAGAAGLRIVADAALAAGDCRIDWPGGGVLRDERTLWREIERVTEAALGVPLLTDRRPEPGADAATKGDER